MVLQFESCNVKFQNRGRYTVYEISFKLKIEDFYIEPISNFFTIKNFFLCNKDGVCLN